MKKCVCLGKKKATIVTRNNYFSRIMLTFHGKYAAVVLGFRFLQLEIFFLKSKWVATFPDLPPPFSFLPFLLQGGKKWFSCSRLPLHSFSLEQMVGRWRRAGIFNSASHSFGVFQNLGGRLFFREYDGKLAYTCATSSLNIISWHRCFHANFLFVNIVCVALWFPCYFPSFPSFAQFLFAP